MRTQTTEILQESEFAMEIFGQKIEASGMITWLFAIMIFIMGMYWIKMKFGDRIRGQVHKHINRYRDRKKKR